MVDTAGQNTEGDSCPIRRCHPLRRRLIGRKLSGKRANLCRYGLMLPVGLIALVAVILHSIVPPMILDRIGDSINADVSAASWEIGLSRIVLNDVRVRSRSVEGVPGEVLEIDRLTAYVTPSRLLSGVRAVEELILEDPTFRISYDTGFLSAPKTNLSGFRLPSTEGRSQAALPAIRVVGGSIDWGEHAGDRYRRMKLLRVEGNVEPVIEGDEHSLSLSLHEILSTAGTLAGPDTRGLIVTGAVKPDVVSIKLQNFVFDEWLPVSAPAPIRPLLEDLDIAGDVSEIEIQLLGRSYDRIAALAKLSGVEVTLPLALEGQSEDSLRLRETSGSLRIEDRQFYASVEGELADVPYEIDLVADVSDLLVGRGTASEMTYSVGVTVPSFSFGDDSDFLPVLPASIRDVLWRFADKSQIGAISPSAIVSADVSIEGSITGSEDGFGVAVPESYSGTVFIKNGATAFFEFPYQFENVVGEIEFTQDELRIHSLFGVAATGAKLSASGRVSPINADAGFDLDIEVFDVPIDRTLREATPPQYLDILKGLVNEAQYAELVGRGLVVPPGERQEMLWDLAFMRSRLDEMGVLGDAAAQSTVRAIDRMINTVRAAPAVRPGGMLGLGLEVRKPKGELSEWDIRITAALDEATIVPEQFPLPIRVRDLAVVIDEEVVTVTRGSAVPVSGLSGMIEGSASIAGGLFAPDFSFRADRLRADELLLYAMAPIEEDGRPNPGRLAAADVVRQLGLNGDTDAVGRMTNDGQGGVEFTIDMGLERITMLTGPLSDRPPLLVTGGTGLLEVRHNGLTIQTDAEVTGISGDAGVDDPTRVQLAVEMDWSDPSRAEAISETFVNAQGVRASAPIEQLISVFSQPEGDAPGAAEGLIRFKNELDPRGMGDAAVRIVTDGKRTGFTTVELLGLRDVSVSKFLGRIGCAEPTGGIEIRVRPDRRTHIELTDLRGDLTFEGEQAGAFVADGTMELSPPDGILRQSRELRVAYTGGRFESKIARSFVNHEIKGAFADEYLDHKARGAFELDMVIEPRVRLPDRTTKPGIEEIARPTYVLRPQWGAFTRLDQDVRMDVTGGAIITEPGGLVRFADLRGEGDGFWGTIAGSLTPDGRGGSSLDVGIRGGADRLTPDIRAMLPIDVVRPLDEFKMKTEGPLRLTDARLRTKTLAMPDGPSVTMQFEGQLSYQDASLFLGQQIDEVTGSTWITSTREPTDGAATIRLSTKAERARASGIELRDVRVRLEGDGERPGKLAVPMFSANGRRGGRVWGTGLVVPVEGQAKPNYELEGSISGLRFAAVLDEMDAAKRGLKSADDLPAPREDTGALLGGHVVLAGEVQNDLTRRGLASVVVSGGELWRVPLLIPLIEVKALQAPTGEALDHAEATLVVEGNVATASYISVQSPTVEVVGYGTITLPEFDLDLALHTRSISPWPVVSKFADAFFDEFSKVSITGTPANVSTDVVAFQSSRRVLRSILASDSVSGVGRLEHIARRAWEIRDARSEYRPKKAAAGPATITTRPAPKETGTEPETQAAGPRSIDDQRQPTQTGTRPAAERGS